MFVDYRDPTQGNHWSQTDKKDRQTDRDILIDKQTDKSHTAEFQVGVRIKCAIRIIFASDRQTDRQTETDV